MDIKPVTYLLFEYDPVANRDVVLPVIEDIDGHQNWPDYRLDLSHAAVVNGGSMDASATSLSWINCRVSSHQSNDFEAICKTADLITYLAIAPKVKHAGI